MKRVLFSVRYASRSAAVGLSSSGLVVDVYKSRLQVEPAATDGVQEIIDWKTE
jgi:GTP cyclohydrolase I